MKIILTSAAARYPEGAKRLRGADTEYIVAPLMSIVEEAYTVYFDFLQPSTELEQPALVPKGQLRSEQ